MNYSFENINIQIMFLCCLRKLIMNELSLVIMPKQF